MANHNLSPARHDARQLAVDTAQDVAGAAKDIAASEALAFTTGSNGVVLVIVGTCRTQRVDDVVMVSGSVTIDLTTTGASVFNIDLPTIGALAAVADAAAISGMYLDADGDVGVIVGDAGSDDAEVTFSATADTARIAHFWFSYVAD